VIENRYLVDFIHPTSRKKRFPVTPFISVRPLPGRSAAPDSGEHRNPQGPLRHNRNEIERCAGRV
jgi:hypothetical protein